MTLSEAKQGKTYTLVGLDAGRSLKERVYSMGLNSGATFKILANSGHGPVGLEVRRTKLGIGRGMAEKIWVSEFDE